MTTQFNYDNQKINNTIYINNTMPEVTYPVALLRFIKIDKGEVYE